MPVVHPQTETAAPATGGAGRALVLLGVDRTGSYGEGIAHGVLAEAVHHPQLRVALVPTAELHRWATVGRHCAGIIAPYQPHYGESLAQKTRGVVVNTSERFPETPWPSVLPDNVATGQLVADFFLARGTQHFAFSGRLAHRYAQRRLEGFRLAAGARGCAVAVHDASATALAREDRRWLAELPRPCALFAAQDGLARYWAEVAQGLGLRIPADLAIVGCDNDALLCAHGDVTLSSVALGTERLGAQALRLVADLLAGQPAPAEPIRLPPVQVVERQSTDATQITDSDVAAALAFIHAQAHRSLGVKEVAAAVGKSRRTLERKFLALLGYSLHDVIQRAHLDKARQLLAETPLPLTEVANRSGFSSARHFARVFRRLTGHSPSELRLASGFAMPPSPLAGSAP